MDEEVRVGIKHSRRGTTHGLKNPLDLKSTAVLRSNRYVETRSRRKKKKENRNVLSKKNQEKIVSAWRGRKYTSFEGLFSFSVLFI